MRRWGVLPLVVWFGSGCGSDGGGSAMATARMLNGASPGGVQAAAFAALPASDGIWQVTPNQITAPLTGIVLTSQENGQTIIPLTGCSLGFDIRQPGLAQSLECPFDLPAGTYTGAGPAFDATWDVLIEDAVNGIYSDPTSSSKVTTTQPAGGAQTITLPNPRGPGSSLGTAVTKFDTPLVVNAGDTVAISSLLPGLQFFQITIAGGQAALGADGNGMPGFPDSVSAAGTPAAISYYVNPALGNAYSYNGSTLGSSHPLGIGVLYSNDSKPAFLGVTTGDYGCGHVQTGFVFAGKGNGYLGLDANGVLGWAVFSDVAGTMYSAVMSMAQVSTLAATTTFKCLATTTDPAPPGDSFASGAPAIPTPSHTETMTLVAN